MIVSLERRSGEDGLRLWVETDGGPDDRECRRTALLRFELLLGILRAYWPDTGELYFELLGGLGEGSTRDPDGNQYVGLPTIYCRREAEFDELRAFATQVGQAYVRVRTSQTPSRCTGALIGTRPTTT